MTERTRVRRHRTRHLLVALAVPAVVAAAGHAAAADPQSGVTPSSPGQAGVTPQAAPQTGVTPAPAPPRDAGTPLADAIPSPPPPRADRPMPAFWPDPSYPNNSESTPAPSHTPAPSTYTGPYGDDYSAPANDEDTTPSGDDTAPDDNESAATPPAPPELTLHLGAESRPKPADVPDSLIRKWNQFNDAAVYQIALAADAAGLPRDQADRKAQVTADGAVAGGITGFDAGAAVGGLGGCFAGMAVGGLAGAAIAGIPTAGVAGPLGATIGGIGGCMAGGVIGGVAVGAAGAAAGAALGGAAAGLFGTGDSSKPPAPEPADTAAEIAAAPENDTAATDPAPTDSALITDAAADPAPVAAADPIPAPVPAPALPSVDSVITGVVNIVQSWLHPAPAPQFVTPTASMQVTQ